MVARRRAGGRAKHTTSAKATIATLFFVLFLIVAACYGVSLVR